MVTLKYIAIYLSCYYKFMKYNIYILVKTILYNGEFYKVNCTEVIMSVLKKNEDGTVILSERLIYSK